MGQLSVFGSILLYLIAFGIPAYASTRLHCRTWMKVLLLMLLPLLLATFRHNVGYDYGSYAGAYQYYGGVEYSSIVQNYKIGDPIGYYLFAKWAAAFGSERVFFFWMAFISLFPPMLYFLKDWADTPELPLILFMYLFGPYIFAFSAIKQGIAIGLLIFSLTYVTRRKILGFLLCIIIACSFHSTAMVFVPIYFLLNRDIELSTWKRTAIIIAVILVMVNLETVLSGLMGGRFEGYALDTVYGKNRSFWLYSLLAGVFFLYRKVLKEIDLRNDLLILMMIIGAMCQILGFSNAFAKRIGEYFAFSQIFLLPQMLFLFNERSQKVAKTLICIYVVGMFLITNPTAASGMGFVPYSYKFW